jgi:hypothetical protein
MTHTEAKALLDKIVGQVFGFQNPLTMEQFMTKFTFDVRLPQPVTDAIDGTTTWAGSTNPVRYVKIKNARKMVIAGASEGTDYIRPKRPLNSIEDVMAAWNEINLTTTERQNDSLNVSESDNVNKSENIFRSQDVQRSKNVLLSDGIYDSEFIAASQRSVNSSFCIRVEDSGECSNSFAISWSGNITNCFFMHDTGDMEDSMFCTNVKGRRFCIANMQYTEEEYRRVREIVARWILTA